MTEPAHSIIGPSSASRWIACSGSVPFADHYSLGEGDGGSEYAEEGTAAHALLEKCLLDDQDAYAYLGEQIGLYVVDQEMADCVQVAVDFDLKWDNDYGPSTYGGVEQRLYLKAYDQRLFGTCDRFAIGQDRVLVLDYKHGAGDVVEVENNPQPLIYALGVLALYPMPADTRVDLVIVQPRAGGVKVWTVTVQDILDWAEQVMVPALERVAQAERIWLSRGLEGLEEEARLVAGSHCVWCPVKLQCSVAKAYLGQALAVTGEEKVDSLPVGDLVDIFTRARLVRRFLKEVEERLIALARNGKRPPGVKLVAGRGTRVWSDQKKAQAMLIKKLGRKAFGEPVLISPAQAEKLIGKPEVAKHAFLREGGMQLALESDKRSGLNVATAKQVFAHLLEGDTSGNK